MGGGLPRAVLLPLRLCPERTPRAQRLLRHLLRPVPPPRPCHQAELGIWWTTRVFISNHSMRKRPALRGRTARAARASPTPQGPLESPCPPRSGPAATRRRLWGPCWQQSLPPPLQVPSEGPGVKSLRGVRPASPPGGPARPAPLQGRLGSLEVLCTLPQEPETLYASPHQP